MNHSESTWMCDRCHTGQFQFRAATLAHWLGAHLMLIPNFPAWHCDVCAAFEYDPAALELLKLTFGVSAGHSVRRDASFSEAASALALARHWLGRNHT